MHFLSKARNTAWSNDRLYRACAALTEVPADLLLVLRRVQALDAITLNAVEASGRPFSVVSLEDVPTDLPSLMRAQALLDWRLVRFCEDLNDDRLFSVVATLHRGVAGKEALHSILAQLFTQQAQGRGEACARLADAGGSVPVLDAFFLEADRQEREADLVRLGLTDSDIGSGGDE